MYLTEVIAGEFRELSDRVLGREHTVGQPVFNKPQIWLEDRKIHIDPCRVSFKVNRDNSVHTVYIWGYVVERGDGNAQTSYSCTLDEAPNWVREDFCD